VTRPVRIGNSSGFYGDRASAARELVEGGPLDVLTGDYLAELTMLILWKARRKDPSLGYARTFLDHLEQVLGTCLDRGTKVVTNAGGLHPAGLAAEVAALADRLGLHPRVAWVTGDDLLDQHLSFTDLDTGEPVAGEPVTANAYLGGWGIAAALEAGADVVVCPRVTDASLVVGPAAWWHGWARDDWDALAGAVAAGHVIECGPQATGGNYAFFQEVTDRRYPGFPLAEVAADGSSTITKQPDTGGLVSVGTVTAQLLYEIGGADYLNPDVITHFDTIRLADDGPHRVRISGVVGSPPTATAKVAVTYEGGFRNTMTLVLTGLDLEAKAARATEQLFDVLGGRGSFSETDVRLLAHGADQAHLRVTVKDPEPTKVGRAFSDGVMQLLLGGYPGAHTLTPPTGASAYGVYVPALIPQEQVHHVVVLPDGTHVPIAPTPPGPLRHVAEPHIRPALSEEPTTLVPLGTIAGARSGDKGGNANVGLWVRSAPAYEWLAGFITVDRVRELLPEAADLEVRLTWLPNLRAVNVVVVGLLGRGVAETARPDPQAKSLGEHLRARLVDLPTRLVEEA
jgi:hypothetical protein